MVSSLPSPLEAREATRSLSEFASLEWVDTSLPALFLLVLLTKWRIDDMEVMLVAADDMVAESRELVVGVLVLVAEEVEPRFGVKLDLALAVPAFLGVFSMLVEGAGCSSLLMIALPIFSISIPSPSPS